MRMGSHKLAARLRVFAKIRSTLSLEAIIRANLTVPLTLLCVGVAIEPSAGKKSTRIFLSWMAHFDVFSTFCQMAVTLDISLSAVIATDCTRNLSRHLASGGGSSFIA